MKKPRKDNWMGVVVVQSKGEFQQEVVNLLMVESDLFEQEKPNYIRIKIDIGYTDRVFAGYVVEKHSDKICEAIDDMGYGQTIFNVTSYIDRAKRSAKQSRAWAEGRK